MRNSFIRAVCIFMENNDHCGLCYLTEEADKILHPHHPPNFAELDFEMLTNDLTILIGLVDERGIIVWANNAGLKRFGLTSHEAIGTCLFDYMAPPVRQRSRALLAEAVATRKPVQAGGHDMGRWFRSLYVPMDTDAHEDLYMLIRKEYVPTARHREFVEVLPSGERVRL